MQRQIGIPRLPKRRRPSRRRLLIAAMCLVLASVCAVGLYILHRLHEADTVRIDWLLTPIWILACACGVGAALGTVRTIICVRCTWLLAKPATRVGLVKGRHAKLQGEVCNPDRLLLSPISREECVLFQFHVRQEHDSSDGPVMKTVIDQEDAVEFQIQDESGHAKVLAGGARIIVFRDWRVSLANLTDAERRRLPSSLRSFAHNGRKTELSESYVTLGEQLYVIGPVARVNDELIIGNVQRSRNRNKAVVDSLIRRSTHMAAPTLKSALFAEGARPFIVSDKPFGLLCGQYGMATLLWLLATASLTMLTAWSVAVPFK